MEFENEQIYHVFNRGNNSQTLFFNNENYLYFIDKVEEYIKPHADILAWCLMPNHFHLMIEVENEQLEVPVAGITYQNSSVDNAIPAEYRTLNKSIAILLRLYSRSVNIEDDKQGALFSQPTKALCLTKPEYKPVYFENHFGIIGNQSLKEKDYLSVCFNFIHLNPVTAKLVEKPEEWEFSSYRDYFMEREGKLVNKQLAGELGLVNPSAMF